MQRVDSEPPTPVTRQVLVKQPGQQTPAQPLFQGKPSLCIKSTDSFISETGTWIWLTRVITMEIAVSKGAIVSIDSTWRDDELLVSPARRIAALQDLHFAVDKGF